MAQQHVRPLREEAPFSGLQSNLIFDFFAVFSRFEYALKTTPGFLAVKRQMTDDQYHEANWDRFVRDTETHFTSEIQAGSEEFRDAIRYLMIEKRPKKEVAIREGSRWRITFEPSVSDKSTDWGKTIDYIKRVRNNLFHGGKYYPEPLDEPGRDGDLLWHCIVVLRTSVVWVPSVDTAYRKG